VGSQRNSLGTWVLVVTVVALIIIQLFGSLSVAVQLAKAEPRTLIVPDNYPTITAAVGNASAGDTIQVRKGEYHENPVIDKTLSVVSSDAKGTVVIGAGGVERGAKSVFTLAADSITISGFTIKSQSYNNTTYFATGVNLEGDKCTLSGNNIVGTYYGIFCSIQSSTTISNNNIIATLKDAIRICGGSENTVTGNFITGNAASGIAIDGYLDTISQNEISHNGRGIGLGASYSIVFGNNLTGNSESGMYFGASNSIVASNNFTQGKWGVFFTSYFAAPNNNTFYDNNFVSNSLPVGTASTYNRQFWDNGSVGNFWSNNNGTDADRNGMTDVPYTVYVDNVDNHPLIAPYILTQSMPPALLTAPKAISGTVGMWHFDQVLPNGATPDSVDNNLVILEPSSDNTFSPILVDGELGKALRFNGTDYAYVHTSPNLNVQRELTIDAWVKVQEYKNVTYNNIVVECMRTPDKYPTRIMGFAINGEPPQNSSSPPLGALRGFFLDDKGVFNEVVTTEVAVPLNQWIHVVFVRSLSNGMHIYTNGAEKNVEVTSGVQNPTGQIAKGTEFYIGHDSISTLDEVSISTTAKEVITTVPLWSEWWFWTELGLGFVFLSGVVFFLKQSRKRKI
jgi:nitrous oxidase accessory protein